MRYSEELNLLVDLDGGNGIYLEEVPATFDVEGETYRDLWPHPTRDVRSCELVNLTLGNLKLSRSDAVLMFGEEAIAGAEKWAAQMMLEEAA